MTDVHVALVTPWRRKGGVASYAAELSDALGHTDAEVTPVPVENSDSRNPLAFRSLPGAVPDDANVVHVQFEAGLFGQLGTSGIGAPVFFQSLPRLEKPTVTTLHEVHQTHPHRGTLGDHLLRARDLVLERAALSVSDVTVVHTDAAENVLRNRHGSSYHIERMLHPTRADVEIRDETAAKDALGVSGPVLLTFGFVEWKKQYEDVIRILPDLPEVTYLVAGGLRDGEGADVKDKAIELAAEMGVADRVHFLGYVDEEAVPDVFSAADAVVLPYDRVSQSGVVNDALAYHRPVVASELPAFEQLREEFGCVLTYSDGDHLYDALDRALFDDRTRARLRERAREYTEAVSWPRFGERTRRLYESLLD